MLPLVLNVTPTSINAFGDYKLKRVLTKGLKLDQVVTSIGLEKAQANGNKFSKFTFALEGPLPDTIVDDVRNVGDLVRDYLADRENGQVEAAPTAPFGPSDLNTNDDFAASMSSELRCRRDRRTHRLMTSLCTNPTGCDAFRASYQRGQNECTGCGGNLAPSGSTASCSTTPSTNSATSAHSPARNSSTASPQQPPALRERLLTELGVDEPLASVNLSLQFRMAETIQELKETIRRGH
jgi:hypothetical protein